MAARNSRKLFNTPVQKYKTVPISDPLEIARIETLINRHRTAERIAQASGVSGTSREPTTADVLELATQLPAQRQIQIITTLASRLSNKELSILRKSLKIKSSKTK